MCRRRVCSDALPITHTPTARVVETRYSLVFASTLDSQRRDESTVHAGLNLDCGGRVYLCARVAARSALHRFSRLPACRC